MRQGRNFEMLRMFRFQGWRSLRGACSQTGRFSHFKGFRASAGCCRKGGTLTRQPTAHRPLQFSGNLPLIFQLMFPHVDDVSTSLAQAFHTSLRNFSICCSLLLKLNPGNTCKRIKLFNARFESMQA